METTTKAQLLTVHAEDAKAVTVTIVRENAKKVSLSCDGLVLIVSADSLREVLNG
jgi:hypothetical protein